MATSSSHSVIDRATIKQDDLPHLSSPLISPLGRRLYKAQFAPLYDFRLRKLRKRVMVNAKAKWEHADKGALATKVATAIKGKGKSAAATDVDENSSQSRRAPPAGSADFSSSQPTITTEDGDEDEESSLATLLKTEKPQFVQRILDIEQGKIAYIIGTAYCSMPMKPDVLEDLTREVSPSYEQGADFSRALTQLLPLQPSNGYHPNLSERNTLMPSKTSSISKMNRGESNSSGVLCYPILKAATTCATRLSLAS